MIFDGFDMLFGCHFGDFGEGFLERSSLWSPNSPPLPVQPLQDKCHMGMAPEALPVPILWFFWLPKGVVGRRYEVGGRR